MTCEARGAEAEEGSWEVKAAGTRGARATQTLVHLGLATPAFKAWETFTVEGPRLVLAAPAVGTGRAVTLVDIFLAPGACESCWDGSGWGQIPFFFTCIREFVRNV